MNKLTRFSALFLLCCLLVPMFSGCGNQASPEQLLAPPLPEPEEITYNTIPVETGTIARWLTIKNTKLLPVDTHVLTFGSASGVLRAIHTKYGEEVKAGDLLAELYSPELERRIYKQEANVRLAELSLRDSQKSGSAAAIERAEIQLDLAQYELNLLKSELEDQKIYAPIDGKISFVAKVAPGDDISAGTTIFKVDDTSQIIISAKCIDASELYLGNQLTMTFNQAYSAQFTGRVVQHPRHIPSGVPSDYSDTLKILLDGIPEGAKVGEFAHVFILLEHKEDVIVLPHKYAPGGRVRVLNANGEPEERTLVYGIDDGMQAEVISGLEVGEQIIV